MQASFDYVGKSNICTFGSLILCSRNPVFVEADGKSAQAGEVRRDLERYSSEVSCLMPFSFIFPDPQRHKYYPDHQQNLVIPRNRKPRCD